MRYLALAFALAFASPASAQIADTLLSSPSDADGMSIVEEFETSSIYFVAADLAAASGYKSVGLPVTTFGGVRTNVTLTPTAYGQYIRVANAAATSNQWNGLAQTSMTQGSFTRDLGFSLTMRAGYPTARTAGNKFIAGAVRGSQAFVGTDNPSAYPDAVYFGYDAIVAGVTQWQICANDAAGSATCTPLGVLAETEGMFFMQIVATPNTPSIGYVFRRLDAAGVNLSGQIASDLPTGTQPLRPVLLSNRGAAGAGGEIEVGFITFSVPY